MQRPRFTTLGLMVVVLFTAIDFAMIHDIFRLWEFLAGSLLLSFALQMGLLCLIWCRGRARRFWFRFELAGLAALGAYLSCPWLFSLQAIVPWTNYVSDAVDRGINLLPYGVFAWFDWLVDDRDGALFRIVNVIVVHEVAFGVPMLLLTFIGGLLAMLSQKTSNKGMVSGE